jgi:hypothetical protein
VTAPVRVTVRLRVTVLDDWKVFPLEARANEKIAAVKQQALAAAGITPARAADYVVKFGGALVGNEARSLSELGVPDGAALVVLAARRRAVR